MPNPSFEPLTLSQELWNDRHHIPQRRLCTEVLAQAQRADTEAQEAASLRQRLENEQVTSRTQADAVTELLAQLAQAQQDYLNAIDEREKLRVIATAEAARASQAEAALEEMQKIQPFYLWDASMELYKCIGCDKVVSKLERLAIVDSALLHFDKCIFAELQRRRSPTGQEKA